MADTDSFFEYLPIITSGASITLIITITAIIFGIVIGIILSVMRFTEKPLLVRIANSYTYIFRSIPLVMILLGFYLVVPNVLKSIFNIHADVRLASAMIAFSLFEAAYFAEIFKSGINAVSIRQFNASKALGFTRMQAFKLFIFPQAYQKVKPSLISQSIALLQDTSLVYVIGLQDYFGTITKIGERTGNLQTSIIVASACYLFICVVLQRISDRIELNALHAQELKLAGNK